MTEVAEVLTRALCKKELDEEFNEDRKESGEGGDLEGCDHYEFGAGECEVVWREMVVGRENEKEEEGCWKGSLDVDAEGAREVDPIIEEVRDLNRDAREIRHVRKKVEKYRQKQAEKLAQEKEQAEEEERARQMDEKLHDEDPEKWDKEQQEKWQAWSKELGKEQRKRLPWWFYQEERAEQRRYRRERKEREAERREQWEREGWYI